MKIIKALDEALRLKPSKLNIVYRIIAIGVLSLMNIDHRKFFRERAPLKVTA